MTIEELSRLWIGQPFSYKGRASKVVWSKGIIEEMGHKKDGEPIFNKIFILYFQSAGRPEGVTLVSHHPNWGIELKEFTL